MKRNIIFSAVRSMLVSRNGKGFSPTEVTTLDRAIDLASGVEPIIQIGLTDADFAAAAQKLGCSVAQIKAVWLVECGNGGGWFTDVRADILALDGPGGFIDGSALPKVLFEAHWFHKLTKGRFTANHPNLSSVRWNRALYVGGMGEWERLYKAMLLDREAALKSASVGAPQIMGFNHKLAGYDTVEQFWDAMKESEAKQLMAFCSFISGSGLTRALRATSTNAETCRAFASGYNGEGYAANSYHIKIAKAIATFLGQ